MKTPTFPLTLLLGCLLAGAAQAADPDALALARAMRTDEIAVAGAKQAFLTGAVEERYGRVPPGCVKKVSWQDYTEGSARVVASVLSPQEIRTALGFFQSDAGTKYVEGLLRRLRASQGEESTLPRIEGKEDISPAQVAAISDFSRSDLGRKIMGKEMTESPAALAFGRDIMDGIAARCGRR
jgi:hypothetical protein